MGECSQCKHGDWMPESSDEPWNACDWCIDNDCYEETKKDETGIEKGRCESDI